MYKYYSVNNLGGGLNLKQDPSIIADNECIIAENCDFYTQVGSVLSRKRIRKLNTTALAGKVKGIYRFLKSAGNSYLMAETDDASTRRIYYSTNNGASFTLLTTRTTGYKSSFVDYEDWLYFADINDEPKRWNGSSLTKWGIAAPSQAPTLSIGEDGDLSGTYRYKVTFLNAEGTESEASPSSEELNVTNKKIDLSDIPISSDEQVTKRKIYRLGGTLTNYYHVATIEDNVTTTYSDNTIDTEVGGLLDPYDRYPAPLAKALAVHFNRIFAGNTIYEGTSYPHGFTWSRARRPENFYDPSNPNPAGIKGKELMQLLEIGESLYMFKEDDIFALRGANEDTFYLDPCYVESGCYSKDSVCRIGTTAQYLSLDGLYEFNGLSSKKYSTKVDTIFLADLDKEQRSKVACVFDKSRSRIYTIYPENGQADPRQMLIYELTTGAFHKWLIPATFIYFDHIQNAVLIGSSDGYIYELESDSPTESSTTFKWRSKEYDFGYPERYKTLNAVRLTVKTVGQDITFNQYVDNCLTHTGIINTDNEWVEIQFDTPESGINFSVEFTGSVGSQITISPPLVFKYELTDIKV